jgi:WD40 repeat protein
MVWYKRLHSYFDFVFLPHVREVVHFEWRTSDGKDSSRRTRNAVMTLSHDNIARLWTEADQGYGFSSFDLAGVIDPAKHLYANAGEDAPIAHIHWLTGRAMSSAVHLQKQIRPFKETLTQINNTKLSDTLAEFPDMAFQVKPNGSLIIWGIQGLGMNPPRVTKVALIMRTDLTVMPVDYLFFGPRLTVHCVRSHDTCHDFAEITIFGQRECDGVLNAYTMNLDDFFSQNWTSPRLCLVHSWCGLRHPVKSIQKHPILPFIAIQDEMNELSVFKSSRSKIGLRSTSGLSIYGQLSQKEPYSCYTWIPCVQLYLVTAYTTNVAIHSVRSDMIIIGSAFATHVIESIVAEPMMNDKTKSHYYLFAFGEGQISTFGLEFDHEECHIDLWNTYNIGPLDFSFSSFDFYFQDLKDTVQHPSMFGTLTGKILTLWHWEDPLKYPTQSDPLVWKPAASFPIVDVDRILIVKFASFGKVAIAHYTNEEYFVDVWDNEFTGLEMTRESRIKLSSEVVALDWFTASDGQHLLAIGFSKEVQVYSKARSNAGSVWIHISGLKVEMGTQLRAIGWLPQGSILVSSSFSSHIYSPRDHQRDGKPRHLFETVSKASGRLFDHDPGLLMQYLLWGKHDLVKYNLSILHRFVKIAQETNTQLHHLPLPLWKLVGPQYETSDQAGYEGLFEMTDENTLTELGVFTKIHVDYLIENLAHSGLEHSEALVAFIRAFEQLEQNRRSLDPNGARYYLGAAYHLHRNGDYALASRDFCWAFFSESQDYIIDTLTQDVGGKILWKDARNLGLGWWITNQNTLKKTFETIARNQYWGNEGSNDPVACSLYYLGLKKKSVLLGLWKLANNHSEQSMMMKFLSNNFDEERWQNAALKNAFALLGKQRYEYAAAFFLLAGKLKDAANVCIKQLQDPQLAVSLCRIYEGDCGPVLEEIVKTQLLPQACEDGDRWLTCMLYSLINEREKAFYCLTRPLETLMDPPLAESGSQALIDPSMLLLYSHLQVHYKKLIMAKLPSISPDEELQFETECVRSYDRLGFPTLALQMLFEKKLAELPDVEIGEVKHVASDPQSDLPVTKQLSSQEIDWDTPVTQQKTLDWSELETKPSAGLDWGELETKPSAGLDWGEMETKPSTGLDWGELETKATNGLDWGEMEENSGVVQENEDLKQVEDAQRKEVEVAKTGKLIVTEQEYFRLKVRYLDVQTYIRFLVMRILHDLHNSADIIVKYRKELANDTTLSNYFDYLRKGFAALSDSAKMDIDDIGLLVKSRCEEMFALNAFVEILPFHDSISPFTKFAEKLFINQTNMLSHVCFSYPSIINSSEKIHYVDVLSRDLLTAWRSWNQKCIQYNQLQLNGVVSQVLVTGFMIQLITATLSKRNNQLWWMLGLCEQLFDLLLKGDRKALAHLLEDALSSKDPVAHPDEHTNGEAPPEYLDEFGIPLYQSDSNEARTAEKLLYSLVLSHVSSALRLYLERLTEMMNVNPELDETHGFLSQAIQKNLAVYIFELDVEVARQWNKLDMELKSIPAYIMECNLTELWSLLCRTADAEKTAMGIIHTKNIKKWDSATFLADDYDDEPDSGIVSSDLILTSKYPILSFAINPLDKNQVAYAFPKGICEIDTSISKTYYCSQPDPKEIGSSEDLPRLVRDSEVFDKRPLTLLNDQVNVRKERSFDSINRLLKRQFKSSKKLESSSNADKGLRMKRNVPLVTYLESHKSLNCFLAGLGDTTSPEVSVKLFQFGTEPELVSYSAQSDGRLTKCRFDPYGAKFGGSDTRGDLHIWKFDPTPAALRPCLHLQHCHHGAINDFCFMDSSSVLATAGISTNHMNVAVWDTLLPSSKNRVTQFQVGEAGMTALLYSARHNLLIAGGKKGMIYVMDMRQNLQVVNSFQAHETIVKGMSINEMNNTLLSGSSSGEIKVL